MGRGKEINKGKKFWLLIGQGSVFSEANFFLPLVVFDGRK